MSRTFATRSATCSASTAPRSRLPANGAEAIAILEKHEFDLVLSDIKMPDKTGYDVFAFARKKWETIPVMLMTGFGYDPNHSIVRAEPGRIAGGVVQAFQGGKTCSAEVRKALQSQTVAS